MQAKEPRTNRIIYTAVVLILAISVASTLVLHSSFSKHTSAKDRQADSLRIADLSQKQLCGPFSLHTAASMLGTQIDFSGLIKACKPSLKRVSMATLQKVARKFGLDAKGYKMTWEKLVELQSPAILYVNRNHFVTVNPSQYAPDASANAIRVFDSDETPEWWSRTKVENSWSGETLVISEARRRKPFKGPRIKFDCLVHDLGDVRVPLNEKVNVPLVFTNVGAKTLKIIRIKTTCGCAKTAVSSEVIQSGQKGKLDIAVDLNKARGSFDYAVAVETNDQVTPIVKARITGRAFNTQLTTRKELLLTAIPRAGHTSKSFVLRDPGDGSLKKSNSAIRLSISPATLAGNNGKISIKAAWSPFDRNKHHYMMAADNDIIIEVVAIASESAPIGEFDGTLEIITEIPNNEHTRIPIRGLVVSSIVAKPAALFFSNAEGKSISKSITIESRTGQTLGLQDISVPNNLPIKVEKQSKDDKAIVLTVTCSPSTREANNITGDILCSFTHDAVLRIPIIIHSQQPD